MLKMTYIAIILEETLTDNEGIYSRAPVLRVSGNPGNFLFPNSWE